jgi:ATP-dependent DNA helicase RecG
LADFEDIRAAMCDLETDLVERKQSVIDRSKIAQAICAYSNDLPNHRKAGRVLVGVTDAGLCAHIEISDNLLLTLSSMRDNGNILPLPIMSVKRVSLDGCSFVVIEVQPHPAPPVRFDGRTWIRVGPRRAIATIDEERILTEKQRATARSFDQVGVPGAKLSDINERRFLEEYLPSAVSRDVLYQKNLEVESQLRGLRMLSDEGMPNLAAVLVLTDDPRRFIAGAYIQFVRYTGSDVFSPIADEKELDGPLAT